jgi:uncharacterized protein involved in exopolysaccharide biosynthesis/Mrp family chromosome partitioning ATPase
VTKSKIDPARLLADNLDASPEISVETIIKKFLVRWRLFVACALLVPLIAVGLSHLIPSTYKSSAQLLIRHQGGINMLYDDIAPTQISLTGATSAELMRSDPVASKMIEAVGVEDADIARPAYKVLFGKAAALIMPLLGREPSEADGSGNSKLKYIALADELKPSITATTLMVDRGGTALRDELIEVSIKSNSREKVAAMVNGLCEAFIAEYNQRSKNEILAAHQTLADQAARVEADLARLRASAPGEDTIALPAERATNADNKPLSSGLARKISELESQLVTLRQSFTDSSPEVIQVKTELERNRALLNNQEAIDAAGELLSTIRKKQRQLSLAVQLFESNQGNLSVVERGLTPRKSKITLVFRYGIPAVAGLVGGMFIGAVAILLLNLLDPRLLVASDVASAAGLPLLGVIPAGGLAAPDLNRAHELPVVAARPALSQTLAKFDLLPRESSRTVTVVSAENESSTAQVALQLSALLARDRDRRVVLVDANFDHPSISEGASAALAPRLAELMVRASDTRGGDLAVMEAPSSGKEFGVLDVLSGHSSVAKAARGTKLPRLSFIGTGRLDLRDEAGSSLEKWSQFVAACHKEFDTVILHAGGLSNSREAGVLAKAAGRSVLVTNSRVSNKNSLKAAAALLAEIGAVALGVIHCDAKR